VEESLGRPATANVKIIILIMAIKSLFVCGNSYSATWGTNYLQKWPGLVSIYGLNFAFVQMNNKAVASAMLFDNPMTPVRPGLRHQLQSMRGVKSDSLLVIFLFPWGDHDFQPSVYTPEYNSCIDIAVRMGFKKILMPNHPDITKTAYMKANYTRGQLVTFRNQYARFNQGLATMLASWKVKYASRAVKFASVDMFNLWDGQGTVADGLHPNYWTHRNFAYWFLVVINNAFINPQ
jgi:hypothetical protein